MKKASKPNEIDAMHSVDEALSQLDDDARQRVMDWVASKYKVTTDLRPDLSGNRFTPDKRSTPLSTQDIKTFMTEKKPSNFYERVACLTYYLEKIEKKTEVKTEDIRKANTDARLSKMSNPALFVKHATHTYGYLTSLGQRKFGLSTRGEAVVDALPDRAGVEKALSDHPFGKKGRRKSKSNK
jgi:hypothetical protein